MKRVLLFIVTTTFGLLLILGIYFIMPIQTPKNLYIPSKNTDILIDALKQKGIPLSFLDKLYLQIFQKPQAQGWVYIYKKHLKRYQFLNIISNKNNFYYSFTIIPGETSYFVLRSLQNKCHFNLKKLQIAYKRVTPFKDGNFLANTYHIPYYFNETDAIVFLYKNSLKQFKQLLLQHKGSFSLKTLKKYLIVASIIQKEAGNKNEMKLIASVIYNRLKKNMRLQMDGTLNYGKYSHTKITPKRIKSDKSFYNTYKHKGLPKEPVCNVSINAFIAALKPAKTNFYYFTKKDKNSHYFSKDFFTHKKNIQKRKKALKKISF